MQTPDEEYQERVQNAQENENHAVLQSDNLPQTGCRELGLHQNRTNPDRRVSPTAARVCRTGTLIGRSKKDLPCGRR